jgi:hypothetical protein
MCWDCIGAGKSSLCPEWRVFREKGSSSNRTHKPFDQTCRVSCLRENLTSSSYGEGLETGEISTAPVPYPTDVPQILKSGCKAEASKLRTAERIVNLIAVLCILVWRIFWLTMINRLALSGSPLVALTSLETRIPDRLFKDEPNKPYPATSLSSYLTKSARPGGYLARTKDPPPGNTVMWRGISRLTDIELGFLIGCSTYG